MLQTLPPQVLLRSALLALGVLVTSLLYAWWSNVQRLRCCKALRHIQSSRPHAIALQRAPAGADGFHRTDEREDLCWIWNAPDYVLQQPQPQKQTHKAVSACNPLCFQTIFVAPQASTCSLFIDTSLNGHVEVYVNEKWVGFVRGGKCQNLGGVTAHLERGCNRIELQCSTTEDGSAGVIMLGWIDGMTGVNYTPICTNPRQWTVDRLAKRHSDSLQQNQTPT